ncbi:MAG TPA: cupredoxin domain-containing protein [Solirubrobacterales bacterium]|nr:cupredoxin domain-containing protein [Solirubrobacterales bacterium]
MRKSTESTDTSRRRWPTVAAIAALGGIAIAGCGGGGGSSTTAAAGSSTTTTSAGGGASTVKVSETEYKLDPSDPSVKAGTVTFDATNDGHVTHSLEVEGPNGDEELKSDLAPGQSGTLTVDLSKPGTYEFYCPIDNHKQLGMEGTVTVK